VIRRITHGSLRTSQTTQRSGRSISGTATGSPTTVDNALNPAWRDLIIHLIANEAYPTDVSSEVADAVMSDMSETAYKLRALAPDSGAYINEVKFSYRRKGGEEQQQLTLLLLLLQRGSFVPDWQKTLYGDRYSRLLATKHKIDPESVQWCELCVANDEWYEREDGRFCKRSWA
jgi:hypothetical protein